MLFVAGGALAAVGAVIAAPFKSMVNTRARDLVRARPMQRSAQSLASASYDEWAGQVGSTFTVAGGQRLTLQGVRPMESSGPRPAGSRDRAFVATFDVLGRGTMAGDLIYTVSHADHGPLQIFISAAADPRLPGRMLAVFN